MAHIQHDLSVLHTPLKGWWRIGTVTIVVAVVVIATLALAFNPNLPALSSGYKSGGVVGGLRLWSLALSPSEQATINERSRLEDQSRWAGAVEAMPPLNQPVVIRGKRVATLLYRLDGSVCGSEVWIQDTRLHDLSYSFAKICGKLYSVNVVCFDPPGVAGGAGATRVMLDSTPPQGETEVKLLNVFSPEHASLLKG